MDNIRRGQIAYLLLKQILREKGFRFTTESLADLQKEVQKIGASANEAREFGEKMVRELIEEMFTRSPKTT